MNWEGDASGKLFGWCARSSATGPLGFRTDWAGHEGFSELVGASGRRWGMFGKCSVHVLNWEGLSLTFPPPLPGEVVLAKMFGTCSGNVRNCWVPLPTGGQPLPPQIFGNVRKCSENVRKCSELWVSPLLCPSPVLCSCKMFGNVRRMFGKCSEFVGAPVPWVGDPSPSPPQIFGNVRQCWEMFGKCSENVRN